MNDVNGWVSRQYDLFQASFESLDKERKYINYGYTITGKESYEERQERLCLEVHRAACIEKDHVIVDVGFGSGEQDFLLARTTEFAHLVGFNISPRQVSYARERAAREGLDGKLDFRLGPAEALPGIEPASIDRVMAIECAFYFDRPRFYERAAEVLKPGGLLVIADISFSDRMRFLTRRGDFQRMGTRFGNQAEWEKFFRTRSMISINKQTRPGAQMSVTKILRTVPGSRMTRAERREWLAMALYSQLIAVGLSTSLLHYDLLVLER